MFEFCNFDKLANIVIKNRTINKKNIIMNTSENQNIIFPRGEKTSADYFTGTAWLNVLVPKDETGTYAVGNVEFEPGC